MKYRKLLMMLTVFCLLLTGMPNSMTVIAENCEEEYSSETVSDGSESYPEDNAALPEEEEYSEDPKTEEQYKETDGESFPNDNTGLTEEEEQSKDPQTEEYKETEEENQNEIPVQPETTETDQPETESEAEQEEDPREDSEALEEPEPESDESETNEEPKTLVFSDDTIEIETLFSPDSVFTVDGKTVDLEELTLCAEPEKSHVFSDLDEEDSAAELWTGVLCLYDAEEEKAELEEGDVTLIFTIPAEDEELLSSAEFFALHDEKIVAIDPDEIDESEHSVSVEVDELGSCALRYRMSLPEDAPEYDVVRGSTLLLSEMFEQLSIDEDSQDVDDITCRGDSVLSVSRYDDDTDWVLSTGERSFKENRTMMLSLAGGSQLGIVLRDSGTTSGESSDLNDFMTNWKIVVGGVEFSDDSVDNNTVIEYKSGMQYSLELSFIERPDLQFDTPETNPPEMVYQLPDCFVVPDDYTVALNVNLGRKGVLPNNILSIKQEIGPDGEMHRYLHLKWNWEDTLHWGYFRDSSQAKLKINISGVFDDDGPDVLSINGKEVAIRKEDLHNAIVNKEGVFDRNAGIITYTVTVTSDGTTSDITLTDTLGNALIYQGDIQHDASSSVNTAQTTPQITPRTGNTFSVVIPAMNDGDKHVFTYSAKVDYDAIAISGSPTFEETGNTAQIFGDSYTLDNIAMYHEMNIDFSDLEKNVLSKRRETIDGKYCYILNWEIETNKRAQYPLADTTIIDTIAPEISAFSRYYGDGLTVKCYLDSGDLFETRQLTWEDLGVDLANDTTWTYHIPDTDPVCRYVLTYDTIVDMSAQTDTVVAENYAEGKGGIDSDRAVLTLPGNAGISVSKKATNVDSTHVT